MIESLLQQIQEALTREAPTIERGKRCSCAEFIDPAMAFTGQKLKYLVSESLDGCCELFVSEHDGRSPCPLLRHEKWHTIAKVVILIEQSALRSIQTSMPIELRDQRGCVDTVLDICSCYE